MKLPNLDPSGGGLYLEEALIEYDGPQVILIRNKGGSRFLGLHTVSPPNADNWLYVRVGSKRIKLLKQGLISLRTMFATPEFDAVAFQEIYYDDRLALTDTVRWIAASDIEAHFFPDEDSYLEPAEYNIDLRELAIQKAPEAVQAVVRRATSALWEIDPTVVEILRSFKTPPHVTATASRRSVVDLAFAVGTSRTDFPVRSLSAVLGTAQSLVDSLGVEPSAVAARGPVQGAVRSRTSLDAIATFPSSFGLRLETNVGDIAGDGPAEIALHQLVYLLNAAKDADAMKIALGTVSRRAQNHFKAFTKALASGRADFKLESATPNQLSTTKIYISEPEIRTLSKLLDSEVSAVQRDFDFTGRLLGVSLKSRFFLLQNSSGEEISGKIDKDCISQVNEKKINAEHIALIREQIDVNALTGEETAKYTLLTIREID